MKNILLVSSNYPMNPNLHEGTLVCHYFIKEWQKMGYSVKVLHPTSLFPRPFYFLGSLFKEKIEAKTGSLLYYKGMSKKPIEYQIDGISVLLVPLFKPFPHSRHSKKTFHNAIKFIVNEFEKDSFIPDVITGHFLSPELELVDFLKKEYPQAKTCFVMHNNGNQISSVYKNYRELMSSVNVWGFRSLSFKTAFEAQYGTLSKSFICYSGIPQKYVQHKHKEFNEGITKFSYVGKLHKPKRVEDTINALNCVFPNGGYSFDIVGFGGEENSLKTLVKNLHTEKHVTFHGEKDRDDAQHIIAQSDCFIMVSSHEAFGLVYIEAMAKGCIVIATKGQGMEGIIKDGYNGFLCESENVEALALTINRIRTMKVTEWRQISENAIKTAQNMTDYEAANHYIKSIISTD